MISQTLYATITRLAAPALRLHLRLRACRGKEIPARLAERRGIDPRPRPPGTLIWLHAASLGEARSLLPVLSALLAQDKSANILLSTGTVSSANMLAEELPALGLQLRVSHAFLPLDIPKWMSGFLDHWRPDVAGFVESELWPNLLAGCVARAIPVILINARLSPRSHARWRRAPKLARAMLEPMRMIHAQSAEDAARFRALGGRHVASSENLKYAAPALAADSAELAHWTTTLAGRPVWLAASLHPEELPVIQATHQCLGQEFPGLLTIIVPRHPERGADMAAALAPAAIALRAAGQAPPDGSGYWIADTFGELGLFYRLAPVVLIGRSLAPPGGGQNPLEPARLGCAVAAGPHMQNFAEISARLEQAGGLARVDSATALADWVARMWRNPAARAAQGNAAHAATAEPTEFPAFLAGELLRHAASHRGGAPA